MRPKKYAMDRTTTEATLQNALLDYEKHQNKKYDICVFLTSNNIFRNYNWITEAVNNLKKDKILIVLFLSIICINIFGIIKMVN